MKLNINIIYALCISYCYGLYGVVGRFGLSVNFLIALVVCLSIYVSLIKIEYSYFSIKFNWSFLIITAIIIGIVISDLMIPFSDDVFSHTYLSLQPSLEILKLANKFDLIPIDQKVSSYLIIINLFIFSGVFAFFSINKNKKILIFIVLSIFIILFRYINIKMGGGSSQHPTFRLFPMFATGSLGLLTNMGFRLQGILPLLLISGILYTKTESYLKTIAIISIPLLLHTSTIIEYSIWYTAGSFLFLNRLDKNEKNDIFVDTILAVLFTLIRQPAILLFLFVVYKIIFLRQKRLDFYFISCLFILILPAIIFLIGSIIQGNPALSHSPQTDVHWIDQLKTIGHLF